ncbi:hypothetical protein GPJ56_001779 [Histomonas meleagridis]|uniref:uncharacterized protein n=1 Tax=Histomonas meleagridis TaxID=135588 RepID=UPI00355A12F6|nr:hypothetical protein GPJ56_001779 [Histomonas meleagridis]KAH0806553.1 hypothetical protein GO595_000715 [Histomonas meleagridis]
MKPSFLKECQIYENYWKMLSEDEKEEYVRICENFKNEEKKTSKDKRIVSFPNELSILVHFIEQSEFNKEARCVLVGICFCGPILCLNNRQLKNLTCRCKSSINGSFQKLGYVSISCKSKSRDCVITALPSLKCYPILLRQWSSRYVSSNTLICFVPSITNVQMPEIYEEDVHEDKRKQRTKRETVFNPVLYANYVNANANVVPEQLVNADDIKWKTEQITNYLSPMYYFEYGDISAFNGQQEDENCCEDLFDCYPGDDTFKEEITITEWNPIVD